MWGIVEQKSTEYGHVLRNASQAFTSVLKNSCRLKIHKIHRRNVQWSPTFSQVTDPERATK